MCADRLSQAFADLNVVALRSMTACYLDVAKSFPRFADGYLLRFLYDQQNCDFWNMYTNADSTDHCVVSLMESLDADEIEHEPGDMKGTEFDFCGTSFEGFLSRFWIENEIGFVDLDGKSPPDVDPRFLELYAE